VNNNLNKSLTQVLEESVMQQQNFLDFMLFLYSKTIFEHTFCYENFHVEQKIQTLQVRLPNKARFPDFAFILQKTTSGPTIEGAAGALHHDL